MKFEDNYTTQDKIDADTSNVEEKKTKLTNDAFAVGEALDQLKRMIALKWPGP